MLEPDKLKSAGEAMRNSGAKAAEGTAAVSLKLIDQAEENARQAFAALRQAAQATNLTDVMKVQSEYLREQSTRSMSQAREVGELIMRFGREAMAPMAGNKPDSSGS